MTAQQCVLWLCLLLFLRLKSPLMKPYRIWQAETFLTTWWKHTHRLLGKGGLSKSRIKDLLEVPGYHSHGSALTLSCFVCSAWRTSSGSMNSGMLITSDFLLLRKIRIMQWKIWTSTLFLTGCLTDMVDSHWVPEAHRPSPLAMRSPMPSLIFVTASVFRRYV